MMLQRMGVFSIVFRVKNTDSVLLLVWFHCK